MRISAGLPILLSALLACLLATAAAATPTYPLFAKGRAFDADNGELLYTETHYCREDQQYCTVEYRDRADELFARKSVDYARAATAPSVRLQEIRGGDERVLQPATDSGTVVDAGFDHYVRDRWGELVAGETLRFDFHALGFERAFAMRAKQLEQGECEAQYLCVQVEVNSWLLGLVAKPLWLTYERESRRLARYEGASNVMNERVEIRYTYAAGEPGLP